MTDNKPLKKSEEVAFDQMELHSDINVHMPPDEPDRRRNEPKGSHGGGGGGGRFWLVFVLLLLSLGGGGYLLYLYDNLSTEYQELNDQIQKAMDTINATSSDLDAVSTDLNTTETNLEQAQSNISNLNLALRLSQKKNNELEADKAGLEKQVADTQANLDKTEKTLQAHKDELQTTRNRLRNRDRSIERLRTEKDQLKTTTDTRIAELETNLEETTTRLTTQVNNLTGQNQRLTQERDKATGDAEKARADFKAESEASLKIIQERNRFRREAAGLQEEKNNLNTQLRAAQARITALEVVDAGDMVPFSDGVRPGTVSYREPLPEGFKLTRRIGPVTMVVLVNESGSVEKAMLLPGQEELLEPALRSALIRTMYKWKFTPPEFENVRVKTWQPVIVRPE